MTPSELITPCEPDTIHTSLTEPVAWQYRWRAVHDDGTFGDWNEWQPGRAPELRTNIYQQQERPLFTHPVPNQLVPEDYKIPCDVMLPPATRIRRGCSPSTLLEAVARAICVACEENPDHQGDARGNEFRWQDYRDVALAAINAFSAAQQPTKGEEITVNTPHGVFILPLHPSGLSSGPRFVVHVPEPQRESVTVRYDLSPAQTESAIRDALIRMGWTPPEGESVATVRVERERAETAPASDGAQKGVVAWARPVYASPVNAPESADGWEAGEVVDIEFHNRAEKPEGEGWYPLVVWSRTMRHERDELRDRGANLAQLQAEIKALRAEVERLRARNEQLAEALRRYGVHDETCTALDIPFCTCGLDAAVDQERAEEQP